MRLPSCLANLTNGGLQMSKPGRSCLLALFIVGFSISAWAQVERGTLAGTVNDSSGLNVPQS